MDRPDFCRPGPLPAGLFNGACFFAALVLTAGFLPFPGAADLPAYLEAIASLRRALPVNPVSAHHFEALQALVADVGRAGAGPIFLITPSLSWRENFTGLPPDVPGFAYNNPAKYPNLDEPDHHYDGWHLNEKGAAEPTSLLARQFAERPRRAP